MKKLNDDSPFEFDLSSMPSSFEWEVTEELLEEHKSIGIEKWKDILFSNRGQAYLLYLEINEQIQTYKINHRFDDPILDKKSEPRPLQLVKLKNNHAHIEKRIRVLASTINKCHNYSRSMLIHKSVYIGSNYKGPTPKDDKVLYDVLFNSPKNIAITIKNMSILMSNAPSIQPKAMMELLSSFISDEGSILLITY